MLADTDVRTSAHRTMEAERWEGVMEVCRRYGVDPRKVEPERVHAVQLFDQLQAVHRASGGVQAVAAGGGDDAGGGQVYEPPGA